jgi:NAD-dependent deacetylase
VLNTRQVRQAAGVLRGSRWTAVLTGAGVSTESGLPDFRSPGGLWTREDPARVASLSAFERDPGAFYDFYRARLGMLTAALPNAAHEAIARLEALGFVQVVITQNIDGLHQRAGSREVVEVHGNLREARCHACGAIVPISEMTSQLDRGARPRCARCPGLLRPNVVLFEEMLPLAAYERAEEACGRCAVLLVVGSSLEVYPAAGLPGIAAGRGAQLVIVNREPTAYDGAARLVLRGMAGTVLPEIVAALEADLATERAGAPERKRGAQTG